MVTGLLWPWRSDLRLRLRGAQLRVWSVVVVRWCCCATSFMFIVAPPPPPMPLSSFVCARRGVCARSVYVQTSDSCAIAVLGFIFIV